MRARAKVSDTVIARRGCLFIVSGPSGVGKTSICTPAVEDEGLDLSVSYTTRDPREGEREGRDYNYVDEATFESMAAAGGFAESATVHGYRYGTAREPVDEALAAGRDLLLDIDVQGAGQIKAAYPEAVAVFLLPPSREHLESRLRGRGTDSEERVLERLRAACGEITAMVRYDYAIVNNRLEDAVQEFLAIVRAERRRVARMEPSDLEAIVRAFEIPK